ncbi:MAG: phosphate-starvation-inducible PsiE family protein [Actinobacteria bacterium]|nr:phosphate-starvation-inducible PsiE family protein [Actinomycetota bacterium]
MPPNAEASHLENHPVDRYLRMGENAVYILAGLLLIASAVVVLLTVGYHLVSDLQKGVEGAVTTALDGLLLVFIVLELLAGIRATMIERQLVAEPFLVVGIIASIKEIIVITLRARSEEGLGDQAFGAAMTEIGVLGLLVLLLAAAAYLVRRKEREPGEADGS